MTPATIANQKRALRMELRTRRNQLTSTEISQARIGLTEQLRALTELLDAKSVACYLSAPEEPNTRDYLNWAFTNAIRILLPISREDGLLDWVEGDGESERVGMFGVPEAVGEVLSPMAINSVDLILIPASAVDREGYRMGWGRGYYDRTIGSMEARPPVYAIIFDSELRDAVPREEHDIQIDGVITLHASYNLTSLKLRTFGTLPSEVHPSILVAYRVDSMQVETDAKSQLLEFLTPFANPRDAFSNPFERICPKELLYPVLAASL